MDISLLIRHRLKELGREQKDLAAAAGVTESYISQLLARKKSPPAPGRTDIYRKIGRFLRLPAEELSSLAELQRREELKKKIVDPPGPLFRACRESILRKCDAGRHNEVRRIFEKDTFGELERLVTQKLLEVTQDVARQELARQDWLRLLATIANRSYKQVRNAMPEFLAIDSFNVSDANCAAFLDPMIESWDIDLKTFGMRIVLNRKLASSNVKRFEFAEREHVAVAPGFEQFLQDKSLSGDASDEEIEFLRALKFRKKQPSPIYYYRELQNLRDPLHFPGLRRPEGSQV